jgi:hypothetical protein
MRVLGDLHGEKLLWDTHLLQPELETPRCEYEYLKLHYVLKVLLVLIPDLANKP